MRFARLAPASSARWTVALVTVCLVACSRADSPAAGRVDLTGAGATFPYPLYRAWFSEYSLKNSVSINYFSVGSQEGLRLLSESAVDFGATDRAFIAPPGARPGCTAVAIPMVTGAIAIGYTLPGIEGPLNFDARTLASIFSGTITRWDDTRLRSLNPGVALPPAAIVVVHRAKGSGTAHAFSDFLATSGLWSASSDTSAVGWPVGIAVEGNEGVAAEVKVTPFAIGFMELAYARQNHIAIGAVRGASRVFELPRAEAKDYPIRTRSWIVLDPSHLSPARGASLVAFVRWALASGGAQARLLEYEPSPPDSVARYDAVLRAIRFESCVADARSATR